MEHVDKFLHQLYLQTANIDSSTQIHIFLLTSNQFSYQILKKTLHTQTKKRLKYRLHFTPTTQIIPPQILHFINHFPIKKLQLHLETHHLLQKTNWTLLKQLTFNSIHIFQAPTSKFNLSSNHSKLSQSKINAKNFESILKLGLKTELFEIKLTSCIKQIFLFEEILNTIQVQQKKKQQLSTQLQPILFLPNQEQNKLDSLKSRYKFYISLENLEVAQLFEFVAFWCQLRDQFCYNCQKSTQFSSKSYEQQQRIFSPKSLQNLQKSSKKVHQSTLKQLRDQTMVIEYKNEQILSLSSSQVHGYSIVLGKHFLEKKIIYDIINLTLKSKYFISLQFECELSFIDEALDLIVRKHNSHCNYLIKIGNYVEITSYRLMLNTTNLPPKIVSKILQLLLLPGHYELIFYGGLQYFEPVKSLFMKKLFIKFNYMLPVSQLSKEVSKAITKMETLADQFRLKVVQFCSLLTAFTYKNFQSIEEVFYSLHIENC